MTKKGPDKPFIHAEGCKILVADPNVEIPWSEMERGHWIAQCVCTIEHYREPRTRPARLDPLDPKTSRHMPQCEFASETNVAVLRVVLKVKDGGGGDAYWWVQCGACDTAWQVPHYAAESVW